LDDDDSDDFHAKDFRRKNFPQQIRFSSGIYNIQHEIIAKNEKKSESGKEDIRSDDSSVEFDILSIIYALIEHQQK
jgi:hypothetical protein